MNIMAEPLYEITKHMHELTDGQISISDFGQYSFLCYPIRSSLFCWSVHDLPKIYERCTFCDKQAFAICNNQKKPYVYRCHMGLTEMVCPIFGTENSSNDIAGYITIGQIVQTDKKNEIIKNIKNVAQELNIDPTELLQHLETLPHLSAKSINAISKYMAIMAEYIAVHNLLPKEVLNMAYKIRKYIADNIALELNIPHLCETFHISKSHLNNLLNETFNMSATKIITHERIAVAKRLIKQGNLNINTISERVGIYDPNYFSKLFKSVTNMTPSEYKKSLQ